MDIAKEYKEAFGVKPTESQLLDLCLIEEYDFDRKINSKGYWITPNIIYIDWSILKDSEIKTNGKMGRILKEAQSRLKSNFRESKINKVLDV